MSTYELTSAEVDAARQHANDPDWCPTGGTSLRRYYELATADTAAFDAELQRRVGADERLWIKILLGGSHCRASIGWRDDPGGTYIVSSGLEHLHHLSEDVLRSFGRLTYMHERQDLTLDIVHHDIGSQYFEPPYTRDAVLRVDQMIAWLNAHRRGLGLDDAGTTISAAPRKDDLVFGLDAGEVQTMVRLAAATADENDTNPDGGEYHRALHSFTDPDTVHRIAVSTWQRIATGDDTGDGAQDRPTSRE